MRAMPGTRSPPRSWRMGFAPSPEASSSIGPAGVFSCGAEEPNALLQLGEGARTVPAARATVVGADGRPFGALARAAGRA